MIVKNRSVIDVPFVESRTVDEHWTGDDDSHNPCNKNLDVGDGLAPLVDVVKGVEHCIESVSADGNQTVDAGRTECYITKHPELASSQSKTPTSILDRYIFSDLI